jgi:ABC-type transporter Mla subunit MlaD
MTSTLADTLAALADTLDDIETDNARALRIVARRRLTTLAALTAAKEALMAASDSIDAAEARLGADLGSLETVLSRVHTHVQELHDLIATLRGQVSAGNAAAQATIQQLDTLSSRIEADTAAAESDTTEPAPEPAPPPAPAP